MLTLLQAAINIDPKELEQLQKLGGMANSTTPPLSQGNLPPWAAMLLGPFLIVAIALAVIMVAVAIMHLYNMYHWGMTDKAVFEQNQEDKKKWFQILILLPILSAVVCIVPILGWIASAVIYIYWIVMTFIYFFKIRKKLQ